MWGTVYAVANQVATYLLKFIWSRPRFDDMLAEGTQHLFRHWFMPFGSGGSSFPSGHTANAAGIFALLFLCDVFPALGRHRRLVTAGCWLYVALMAFSRILIGRHFLSDTLAASALMALLFYAVHHSKRYRQGLPALLESAASLPKSRKPAAKPKG